MGQAQSNTITKANATPIFSVGRDNSTPGCSGPSPIPNINGLPFNSSYVTQLSGTKNWGELLTANNPRLPVSQILLGTAGSNGELCDKDVNVYKCLAGQRITNISLTCSGGESSRTNMLPNNFTPDVASSVSHELLINILVAIVSAVLTALYLKRRRYV
jgi:hypothetical protein